MGVRGLCLEEEAGTPLEVCQDPEKWDSLRFFKPRA